MDRPNEGSVQRSVVRGCAARELPSSYKDGVMNNNDSGLVVAGLCFLGALAVLLVGACVLIAEAVVLLLRPYV